jgi:hypothetical protein
MKPQVPPLRMTAKKNLRVTAKNYRNFKSVSR